MCMCVRQCVFWLVTLQQKFKELYKIHVQHALLSCCLFYNMYICMYVCGYTQTCTSKCRCVSIVHTYRFYKYMKVFMESTTVFD